MVMSKVCAYCNADNDFTLDVIARVRRLLVLSCVLILKHVRDDKGFKKELQRGLILSDEVATGLPARTSTPRLFSLWLAHAVRTLTAVAPGLAGRGPERALHVLDRGRQEGPLPEQEPAGLHLPAAAPGDRRALQRRRATRAHAATATAQRAAAPAPAPAPAAPPPPPAPPATPALA